MWVTNGLGSGVVFVLMKNDPKADPPYKGMTCFITEKEPWAEKNEGDYAGLEIPPKIKKMGYKGVESTELVYTGYKCPPERILGGEEDGLGQGFVQMMDALEVGRVNVAARGVGIAQRALELALHYSQERKTFGKPIAQHQAIQFKLADMATKIEAARLMTRKAARMKDAGERSDLEAGMAKLLASETGKEVVEECFRIHGGYGYSKEYEIERLYRDAPLLLIGEGTSEIQRMVIGKKLLRAPQDLAWLRPARRPGQRREPRDRRRDRAAARRRTTASSSSRAPAIPRRSTRGEADRPDRSSTSPTRRAIDAARERIEARSGPARRAGQQRRDRRPVLGRRAADARPRRRPTRCWRRTCSAPGGWPRRCCRCSARSDDPPDRQRLLGRRPALAT